MSEVVIIDDDIITLTILKEALADYDVAALTSPLEGLALIESLESPPYLLILDVKMPEMNGFELCTKVREIVGDEDTEIIFHTSSSDLEERLHGYEVGANDFLIKPIGVGELRKKARSIVTRGKERRQIEEQSENNSELIKNVLSDLGEQNMLIHFFRASFNVTSIPSLLKLMVKSMTDFGLKSSVQAKYVMNNVQYLEAETNEEQMTSLERELLDRLTYSDRIMTRGKRLFLNYPPFTQIIKNMPDDAAQAGRYRDHLAIILEAAIARYQAIVQANEVELMIEELEVVHAKSEKENINKTQRVIASLTKIVEYVENNIFDYGLTEEQENQLLEMFKSSTDQAYEAIDDSISSDNLRIIVQRLKELKEFASVEKESEDSFNDVELF